MRTHALEFLLAPMASQVYASDVGPDEATRLQDAGAIKRFSELNPLVAARVAGASPYETELEHKGDRLLYQVELRERTGQMGDDP